MEEDEDLLLAYDEPEDDYLSNVPPAGADNTSITESGTPMTEDAIVTEPTQSTAEEKVEKAKRAKSYKPALPVDSLLGRLSKVHT